jgi:hypothetical protein
MKRLALLLPLLVSPAFAQQQQLQCADYLQMAKQLKAQFQEQRVAYGLASNGQAVALFTSADGSTWSVLRIEPAGRACIVSAGESWQVVEAPPPGDPT